MERGANMLAQDKDGWALLHWASYYGHARMLVEHGADGSTQTQDGIPLQLASRVMWMLHGCLWNAVPMGRTCNLIVISYIIP